MDAHTAHAPGAILLLIETIEQRLFPTYRGVMDEHACVTLAARMRQLRTRLAAGPAADEHQALLADVAVVLSEMLHTLQAQHYVVQLVPDER